MLAHAVAVTPPAQWHYNPSTTSVPGRDPAVARNMFEKKRLKKRTYMQWSKGDIKERVR